MRYSLIPVFCAFCLFACSTAPKDIETVTAPRAAESQQTTPQPAVSAPSGQPQVPSAQAPKAVCKLQPPKTIFQQPFVLSSLQSLELNDNQILVIFETESGDVRSVRLNKDLQILADTEIAPFAQIGCAETTSDGYRIGLIRRDPQTASYTLDIQSFDKTGTAKDSWKAVSRGFVPDPGSRCAFLDSRKLIVNGTRPRGDRPP
jgi:hypothetical protein